MFGNSNFQLLRTNSRIWDLGIRDLGSGHPGSGDPGIRESGIRDPGILVIRESGIWDPGSGNLGILDLGSQVWESRESGIWDRQVREFRDLGSGIRES